MKQYFLPIFISAQLLFIVLYIYKSSLWMKESYHKQQLEQTYKDVQKQKLEVEHQLQALKNQHTVKEFAVAQLKMSPLTLKQVKTLTVP